MTPGKKKGGLALLIGEPDDSDDEQALDGGGDVGDALKSAAADLIAAINAKDAGAVAEALKATHAACAMSEE